MKRSIILAHTLAMTLLWVGSSCGQINWDGGNGEWNDGGGKWNGGQVANDVFGRTNGLEIGSGEVSEIVNITSGNVTYDPNTFGDFRIKSGGPGVPGGTLNLST